MVPDECDSEVPQCQKLATAALETALVNLVLNIRFGAVKFARCLLLSIWCVVVIVVNGAQSQLPIALTIECVIELLVLAILVMVWV